MRQVFVQRGQIGVEAVPAPLVKPGHLLVEVAYSLISPGTEVSGVQSSGKSLLARALEQPDRIRKVVAHLQKQGIRKTVEAVHSRLDAYQPSGYSCAGVVVQVGAGVTDLHPGNAVACAGAGIANHAEIVLVPRNLAVKVPAGCGLRQAASVTLGAIALQGVRRADAKLGETVAVIGLGLLGQLTVQLLRADGCRVIGTDLDPRRAQMARAAGAEWTGTPADGDVQTELLLRTGGHGADVTIITAAAESDGIVQQAMEITRRKGRVVVVGAVGLGLQRSPFYEKEIDLLISCSYGPGRYDPVYEQAGLDYPYAYVRWTENRNLSGYLQLIADGAVQPDVLLEEEFPLAEAARAFAALQTAEERPLGVLLRYASEDGAVADEGRRGADLATKIPLRVAGADGRIRIAVVGAGSFARAVHLPNLRAMPDVFRLRAVVSGTGHNAWMTAQEFGADYCSTNLADVLQDPEIDAVLIATRHHLHAQQAAAAALAGKAVFLEKPMALAEEELAYLQTALAATGVPFLVGYNRRFSPAAAIAQKYASARQNPLMIAYRVNAGRVPPGHWVHGPEGGGRAIGEACHMLDFFQFLVGAPVESVSTTGVQAASGNLLSSDNFVATVRYTDGSVANLFYSALGAEPLPKEYVEIFVDGKVLVIDDFREVRGFGAPQAAWQSAQQDKGHAEALRVFARMIRGEAGPPIALASLVETSRVSFAVAAGEG